MSEGGGRRVSLWAIASLVCSALVCPPLCAIGPPLGVVGLLQTRPGRGYAGRRLAVAGIALGLVLCAGWTGAAAWWHVNVRRPMLEGPRAALDAGLAGDAAAFAAAFTRDGAETDLAAAERFLAAVGERYGRVLAMTPDPTTAPEPPAGDFDTRRFRIPYRIRFERSEVRAEAVFVRSEGGGLPMVLAWGSLAIRDPELGDLIYPDEERVAPAAPEPTDAP